MTTQVIVRNSGNHRKVAVYNRAKSFTGHKTILAPGDAHTEYVWDGMTIVVEELPLEQTEMDV